METRAMSIAFFYALGTAAGGISGPLLFAKLTETGVVGDTVLAFQIGAGLMCAAGLVAAFLAVKAERRSLEDIARPLSAVTSTRNSGGRYSATRYSVAATSVHFPSLLSWATTRYCPNGAVAGIMRR